MKSRKQSEEAEGQYGNKVAFQYVWNDGDVGWGLCFFDNGDLTLGFLDRRMDAIGPVPSPEEFKHQFPTDPAFHAVHVSPQALEWIRAEVERAMSRKREHSGPWLKSELEDISNALTIAIDEKRQGDWSFFGGTPWPRNSPAQGPEAMEIRCKAQQLAQEVRRLAQKYNNEALIAFNRFNQLYATGESDSFRSAPLQQAVETLLNDGWRPTGTLALEYLGKTADGEAACIHMVPYSGSGLQSTVQAAALRTASCNLMNKVNEKPAPTWFRRAEPALKNQSEDGETLLPPFPVS